MSWRWSPGAGGGEEGEGLRGRVASRNQTRLAGRSLIWARPSSSLTLAWDQPSEAEVNPQFTSTIGSSG